MAKTITVWIDKVTDNLGSPDALKIGLAFWVIVFSVSQLAIFFAFLAPQIDSGQTIAYAIQQITGFQWTGFHWAVVLAFGKVLVSAVALIVINLKVVSLLAFALLAIAMVPVAALLPDAWLEPVHELVLLGEVILAAVVILIAALEVLPFVL